MSQKKFIRATVSHKILLDFSDSDIRECDANIDTYERCWKMFCLTCEHKDVAHYVGLVRRMHVKIPLSLVLCDTNDIETSKEIHNIFAGVLQFLGFSSNEAGITSRRSSRRSRDTDNDDILFNTI